MITDKGKTVLAKYLIGQAPAYASHIALGVGSTPLSETDSFGLDERAEYAQKEILDFEVLRIPISSRGYVYDEAGVANIVFAGELPGDQRYLFSEIGIFSAKSNPAAGAQDSRMIYTFLEPGWEYHTSNSATSIPLITSPLNNALEGQSIIDTQLDENDNEIKVFKTNSNNPVLVSGVRSERYEPPRFLSTSLLIPGNLSDIESSESGLSINPATTSDHLHLTGISTDFNRNSSSDQLKLAFSILDRDAALSQSVRVGGVRIILEFASSDALDPQNFARFEVDFGPEDVNFATNRYIVVTKTLGDLIKSTAFTWNTINVIKIYAMVYDSDGNVERENPTDFYIALDGLRLENVTSQNPLYGMTGYTVIRTEDGQPVIKEANSSNLVEFRYGLDVA